MQYRQDLLKYYIVLSNCIISAYTISIKITEILVHSFN